jgi:hypothetical protein
VCVVRLPYLFLLLAMVRTGETFLSVLLQIIGERSLLWTVVAGRDVGAVSRRGVREREKWIRPLCNSGGAEVAKMFFLT